MFPGALLPLAILLAFVPGWVYLRLASRLRPQTSATSLGELLEVMTVGAATTGAAAALVTLAPHSWLPFVVQLDTWAREGKSYPASHARAVEYTAALTFALALTVAYLLYFVQRLRLPAEFRPQGNVWVHSLGDRPKDFIPWVGLRLIDGNLVEGLLHSYSLDDSGEDRDVALARPIRVTPPQCTKPHTVDLDRAIFSAGQIKYITVVHVPEKTVTKGLPRPFGIFRRPPAGK